MKDTTILPRPIVIVTGANGCVYYLKLERFLIPSQGSWLWDLPETPCTTLPGLPIGWPSTSLRFRHHIR